MGHLGSGGEVVVGYFTLAKFVFYTEPVLPWCLADCLYFSGEVTSYFTERSKGTYTSSLKEHTFPSSPNDVWDVII